MKRIRRALSGRPYVLAGIVGVAALSAVMLIPESEIELEPERIAVPEGETFVMRVVVESSAAVNVFAGDIAFDPRILAVESISYNTSIADIWVEKPWYENGAGTINFGGGTTVRGGFSGEGELLAITFRALRRGDGAVSLKNARLLLSDGLGTDAAVAPSIDALVSVGAEESADHAAYVVVPSRPAYDLDYDGAVTYADVSAFVVRYASASSQLDFDQDGSVGLSDFRLLIAAARR